MFSRPEGAAIAVSELADLVTTLFETSEDVVTYDVVRDIGLRPGLSADLIVWATFASPDAFRRYLASDEHVAFRRDVVDRDGLTLTSLQTALVEPTP